MPNFERFAISTVEGRTGVYQWSFWAMTEAEPPLVTALVNRVFLPPEQRSENAVAQALVALKKPLAVLEGHLGNRDYLLGNEFTLADLNAAAVVNIGTMVGADLSASPKIQGWLARCGSRPANQRASQHK